MPGSRATRRSRACSSRSATRRPSTTRTTGRRRTRRGSAKVDAYVICPCSMGTLGTIASGAMQNLIHRAASVALKEERRLILMPRETPLSTIHLRNMLTLREAGATILFLAPGFYHGAETVADLVDFIVARTLDQLGLDNTLCQAVGTVTVETGTLARRGRAADVRPDRAGLRRDEPRHDRRASTGAGGGSRSSRRCARATACSTPAAAPATSRSRRCAHGADEVVGLDFSRADARAGAAQGAGDRVGPGRRARAPVRRRVVRRGDGRLRRPQRRRSRGRRSASCGACCGRADGSRSSRSRQPRRRSRAVLPRSGSTGSSRCSARCCPAARRTRTCPRASAGSRRPRLSPTCSRANGFDERAFPPVCGRYRGIARGRSGVTVTSMKTATMARSARPRASRSTSTRSRSGSRRSVASHPGLVAAVGNEALAAGGKRLRPLLVFLSTPVGREPSIAAGVAVELVHMASLIHDDLIDRAHFRRGKAAAWSVYGAGCGARHRRLPLRPRVRGARRDRRRGGGERPRRRDALPRARRGDAAHADERPVDDRRGVHRALRAQDRKALRGGVPAGRRLGRSTASRSASPSRSPTTSSTARAPRSRRERSPAPTSATARRRCRSCSPRSRTTSCARRSPVGRSTERSCGLPQPARSTRSRRLHSTTLDRARACLNGELHREELESLTHAVVNRER